MQLIYQCEPTLEGFLTAVFVAYKNKANPLITSERQIQLPFGGESIAVQSDLALAKRVYEGIEKILGNQSESLLYAYASDDAHREDKIFRYLRLLFCHKKSILQMLNMPDVIEFNRLAQKTLGEAHAMRGFLRFAEMKNGGYYAAIHPENDILPFIISHFVARYNNMCFVIHDTKRLRAAVYNGQSAKVIEAPNVLVDYSSEEKIFSSVWQLYFKTVTIKERENKRLQSSFLPKKYRKNMLEFFQNEG